MNEMNFVKNKRCIKPQNYHPCKKASCLGRPGLAWAVPTGPAQTGPKLEFLKNANEKPALAGPGRPKTDI